jgi:ribosome-binding factor A
MASNRPERVADAIRDELSRLLSREVHDPGVGFVTLTKVKVSPDLQLARVYYTTMGDEQARRETGKALGRATRFLRRQVGQRIQLRRVPELQFFYDQSVAHHDRVEQILQELKAEEASRADESAGAPQPDDASERGEASHANGAGPGAPASEHVGGPAGAKPPGHE